jgi:ABC-2 type transport system permease protein
VGMVALYPMMFMSGATLPIELLPQSIRNFAQFLPLTYVVTLLRGLWLGEAWSQHLKEVAILTGIMIVATLVAAKVFRWE